jgi:hypothetical protein
VRAYIGVPAYGGIEPAFVQSLLAGALVCQQIGIAIEVDLVSHCSLIAKARNEIADRFLKSDYDALFFIDADIAFEAADLVRMLQLPHEAVGGGYVKKDGSGKLNLVPIMPPVMEDGLQEVARIGTGFLRLTRAAFARMDPPVADGIGCYFNCGVRDGQYWGEDYAFCEDFRAAGGRIWLHPCALGHVGKHTFRRGE